MRFYISSLWLALCVSFDQFVFQKQNIQYYTDHWIYYHQCISADNRSL